MKMWSGRFGKESAAILDSFNSSIAFDKRMYKEDIQGSLAHAEMLGAAKIIPEKDVLEITKGLNGILSDLESGKLKFNEKAEDIHMFIESELTARIGDAGKRLHTARSRNDQVALDIRLYLNSAITEIATEIKNLITVLCSLSGKHTGTIMCGYTHLQRAQPIVFGHHLMAYAFMFIRDCERLLNAQKRIMQKNPLGCGALAGTTYPIDRHMTSGLLGFGSPAENSLDGVASRDLVIETASALAIYMTNLSRFAEEIILWSSWEFKYIELDDAYATGSSIMPQKKNPDIAELVRGKSGRVIGNLNTLLIMVKGTPLAYNKDMQEDKEAIFDSIDNVLLCTKTFAPMLMSMEVLKDNMRMAASKGFINATDLADYLTKKGMPFRDAYKISGEIVGFASANNTVLEELSLEFYKSRSPLFDEDIFDAISLETCVKNRKSYGGPSPDSVALQIKLANEMLANLN